MSGILAPPGNPAFPNTGRPWRDLPSNKLRVRENRPACKPELKYLGELSASHFLPKGRNCPADHETKRIKNALTRNACTEMHFSNQLSRTITQGCERSGCDMLNTVCRAGTGFRGILLPALVIPERSRFHR